jgi:hypothetical protein
MPNLCNNNLTVSGQGSKAFFDANGGESFSLQHAVPSDGSRTSHIELWGTKWDVDGIDAYCEQLNCVYNFNTAWSPPIQWVLRASKLYPTLEFSLEYEESGCDFRGSTTIQNGVVLAEEEGSFFRDANEEDVNITIEELGLGPCISSDLVAAYLEDFYLDNLTWNGSLEGNVASESLREAVEKRLCDDTRRRGRERVSTLFYSVKVLKKFIRRYVEYVNAPGGAVYEKTRARFEQMVQRIAER